MTDFKIETGVPISVRGRGLRGRKYPFREMDLHDSFFVPAGDAGVRKTVLRMSTACSRATADTGAKFAVRSEVGGVRVWRIA